MCALSRFSSRRSSSRPGSSSSVVTRGGMSDIAIPGGRQRGGSVEGITQGWPREHVRRVTLQPMPQAIHELIPGVVHWSAKHPNIGVDVSSYYLVDERVLIDPIAPEGGLDWFEGR